MSANRMAIPLVLPNDCTWDEHTGEYEKKTNVERKTLYVISTALDQLREIKGPVCVVSIAGPCRIGKSYILGKAFDQGEVVQNLNDKSLESQVNSEFLEGVHGFKAMIKDKLAPKKSINENEFIDGEALAALVQLFVEVLNTPGAVPNVQNAWDTFVHTKCTEVVNDVLKKYQEEMTPRVKDKIPCEADVIRSEHKKVMDACLVMFNKETFTLSSKSVKPYLEMLTEKTSSTMSDLMQENRRGTEGHCKDLLKKLKERIVNPVLARLRGPEAAKMEFKDLVEAYDKIEENYKMDARGAKDVQATVFKNFLPELRSEMQQHIDVLKRMKDYDEQVEIERAKAVIEEEQKRRFEEEKARLEEEMRNKEKEIALLQDKQKVDEERLQQMFEDKLKEQKDQLTNMMEANFEKLSSERQTAVSNQNTLEEELKELKTSLSGKSTEITKLKKQIEGLGFMDYVVKTIKKCSIM